MNAVRDQRRGIQSECLYIHHTGGYGRHSDAVPIGFAYALERHEQDIGFFRPIATSKSARGEVIRRVRKSAAPFVHALRPTMLNYLHEAECSICGGSESHLSERGMPNQTSE